MKTTQDDPKDLLTIAEAARILRICPQTLNVWRCTNRYDLPFIKVGRHIRYRRADLQAWIDSRRVTADVR